MTFESKKFIGRQWLHDWVVSERGLKMKCPEKNWLWGDKVSINFVGQYKHTLGDFGLVYWECKT